jgi:HAD superfamily hydrolase (TIGR01484 family)
MIVFDLDDTLAPSKSRVDPSMATLLTELLDVTQVCIISGGRFEQFESQVLNFLGGSSVLAKLHIMPTCGTRYFRYAGDAWTQVYAHDLSAEDKTDAIAAITQGAKSLGYWQQTTWGPIIEDRGSQITFSALGQEAPVDEKRKWDPDGSKKEALRRFAADRLPNLEVRSGGSTSVDITQRGVDKAFGVLKLEEETGIPLSQFLFIGDRLDEGGNDYPVKALGVKCISVTGWQDTKEVISTILNSGQVQAHSD